MRACTQQGLIGPGMLTHVIMQPVIIPTETTEAAGRCLRGCESPVKTLCNYSLTLMIYIQKNFMYFTSHKNMYERLAKIFVKLEMSTFSVTL